MLPIRHRDADQSGPPRCAARKCRYAVEREQLIHGVAVAVELGDAGEAIEIASRIKSDGLSVERQTRLLVDVAAAHLQRNRLHLALTAIAKAEDLSPAFIHGHPYPRDVIGKLFGYRHVLRRN